MAALLYGFHQLKDVLNAQVTDANIPRVNTAITAALAEYQRQVDAMVGLFCVKVTRPTLRFESPLVKRLQTLDENGRARVTKGAGTYDIGFPIQGGGDAWGANYVTAQFLTPMQINNWLSSSISADLLWMRDHILAALFADASYTHNEPSQASANNEAAVTVLPLANGDSQEYLIQSGQILGATDTHLLGYNHAIGDAYNPFPTLRRELVEHPENGGERATVIALVSTNLIEAVEGLTTFKEPKDADIQYGTGNDLLQGRLDIAVPGVVRGKTNNVWVAEWGSLPDSVIIGVTVEGDRPLGMREYDKSNLQGFFELPARNDTPYLERQFQRWAGFGAYNRVGAVCYAVGAASWSVPTGYAVPMP